MEADMSDRQYPFPRRSSPGSIKIQINYGEGKWDLLLFNES
jgi:hypothetical protein